MKHLNKSRLVLCLLIISIINISSLFSQNNILNKKNEIKTNTNFLRVIEKTFPNKTINIDKENILKIEDEISVLVATPDAEEFNTHLLSIMQDFNSNITYTVTSELGSLTVDQMLNYDLVWTFNLVHWNQETGLVSSTEWSDKLGEYLDLNGRLIECEFVQSFDLWGLDGGAYIEQEKSPFTKATSDVADAYGTLGNIDYPNHPIVSGVENFYNDYFYQNVTVRDNATLIASYLDGYPLVAINDKVVAFNANPLAAYGGGVTGLSLFDDGYKMIYNSIVYLKSTIEAEDSPGEVTNLSITPGENGANTAFLSWTNPTISASGSLLTSLDKINIYINNDTSPISIVNNPTMGEESSCNLLNVPDGVNKFKVVGENEFGEGIPSYISEYIGFDVPSAVTNLTLEVDGEDGILTWEEPTLGYHNGVLDSSPITYKIIRVQDNEVIAENNTTTTFTDNNVPEVGLYSYKVISVNDKGEGGSAISNSEVLGPPIVPPYFMGFEDGEQYSVWTIIDANQDGSTWSRFYNIDGYDGYAMVYYFNFNNDADDWLISPQLNLESGKTYNIKLKARKNSPTSNEKFKVFIGKGATPEYLTTEILNTEEEQQVTTEYEVFETTINITSTDTYYVGIKATSQANQFYLYVDDFEIIELSENNLLVENISRPLNALVNYPCKVKVNVKNLGANDATNYSVNLLDESNTIIGSALQEDCPNLSSGEQVYIPITFYPSEIGEIKIKCNVDYNLDEDLSNNTTEEYTINVVPNNGNFEAILGDGVEQYKVLPVNFYWNNSLTQVIYYEEQINIEEGKVKELTYHTNFYDALFGAPIKIWFANSTLDYLDDWVPKEEFTLVFDGTVDFPQGDAFVSIDLIEDSFTYTGDNLIIMVEKNAETFQNNCYFYETPDPFGRTCSMYYYDNWTEFDFSQMGINYNKFPNAKIKFEYQNSE